MGRLPCIIMLAATLLPSYSFAQVVEITPHTGMYTPIGLLVKGIDKTDDSFFQRRQLGSVMIGARMALRTNHTFGLESSVAFAPGQIAITDRDRTVDVGGAVTMMSIRPVVRVHGEMARGEWSFHLAPGLGIVHRSGTAWDGTHDTTDRAFVISGGWRLGRLNSGKAFRFDIENYITRAAFEHPSVRSEPRLHHDLIWSFGLSIPMTR